jgi:hypothetical protein
VVVVVSVVLVEPLSVFSVEELLFTGVFLGLPGPNNPVPCLRLYTLFPIKLNIGL